MVWKRLPASLPVPATRQFGWELSIQGLEVVMSGGDMAILITFVSDDRPINMYADDEATNFLWGLFDALQGHGYEWVGSRHLIRLHLLEEGAVAEDETLQEEMLRRYRRFLEYCGIEPNENLSPRLVSRTFDGDGPTMFEARTRTMLGLNAT